MRYPRKAAEIINRSPSSATYPTALSLGDSSCGSLGLYRSACHGSRYSPDTFRIRDFLSKNRVLFTWLDLEVDPQVNQLLKQFGVTEGHPSSCLGCSCPCQPSDRELAEALASANRCSNSLRSGHRRPPVRRGWRQRSIALRRITHSSTGARGPSGQAAAPCVSRTISASLPEFPAATWRTAGIAGNNSERRLPVPTPSFVFRR